MSLSSVSSTRHLSGLEVAAERPVLALDPDLEEAVVDGLQVREPPLGGELALVQDDDRGAEGLDVGQDVRGEEDLDVLVRGDVGDELQDLRPALGVEVRGRLVEEEELGVVDQGLGHLEPLLHAGRVGVEEPVARFFEPDVKEDLMGPLHGFLPRHAGELAEIGGVGHGVHAGDEAVVLGHVADGPADGGLFATDVVAEDGPLPFFGREEAEEDAQERALAGAVRAEQPDGAVAEAEAHVVERPDIPIAETQVLDFDAHRRRLVYSPFDTAFKKKSSRGPWGLLHGQMVPESFPTLSEKTLRAPAVILRNRDRGRAGKPTWQRDRPGCHRPVSTNGDGAPSSGPCCRIPR